MKEYIGTGLQTMQFLLLLQNIPKLQLKTQLLTIHWTKVKEKVFTFGICFWAADISMIKLPYIKMCGCEQPQCLCRLIYWKRTVWFHSQKPGCKFHFIANSWQRTKTSYFTVFPMWCITTHTTLLFVVCTVKLKGQIQQPYRLNTFMFLL